MKTPHGFLGRARSSLSTERDGPSTSKRSSKIRPTVRTPDFDISLGSQSQIPIHSSNCLITQLKLDKSRKALLERKKRVAKEKNKHKEGVAGLDWAVLLHLRMRGSASLGSWDSSTCSVYRSLAFLSRLCCCCACVSTTTTTPSLLLKIFNPLLFNIYRPYFSTLNIYINDYDLSI